MNKLLAFAFAALLAPALALALPAKVGEVEGVAEYRLPNGLRVLLAPDASADTVTVHITYLVGSLHEGYGEKGMAHLLEHMLFKGSKRHPDVKQEFTRRGARWNGITSYDRTNYFETLPASEENLDWALGMEADRMRSLAITQENFENQRQTVMEERRQSYDNQPYAKSMLRINELAYGD